MGRTYVYGLYVDGECFYVGSTKLDPQDRWQHHLWEAMRGTHTNERLAAIVNKVGPEKVTMQIIQTTDEAHRWDTERLIVEQMIDEGVPLVNKMYNERPDSLREYWLDYEPIITDKQLDHLFANPGVGRAANPSDQPLLEKVHEAIVLTIKVMVERHRAEVERDCPRLIDWHQLHIANG